MGLVTDTPPTDTTPMDRAALLDRFLALRPVLDMHLTMKSLPPELKDAVQSITLHQIVALKHIVPDGLIMRDLARALDITDGSAAVLSDRLVKSGLAVRCSDPSDRRVVWLVGSEKAKLLIGRFLDCERTRMQAAFSVLDDDELACFMRALEHMAAASAESHSAATTQPGVASCRSRAGLAPSAKAPRTTAS